MSVFFLTGTVYAAEQIVIPYSESGAAPVVATGSEVFYTSGTYYFKETDLKVAARSIPMVWERSYRSNKIVKRSSTSTTWSYGEMSDGPLGYGWSSPWFIRIEGDAYVNADGRYFYFTKDSGGVNYLPNLPAGLVLRKTTSGYELLKRGENTYIFNTFGKLTAVKDPRGNTATLTYDPDNKL